MTALKVIGIIFLFFVFLFSLKATVTIAYDGEVRLFVRVLFLKIKILPKKEKNKKMPRSMSAKKAKKISDKLESQAAKKRAKKQKKKQKKAEKKAVKDAEQAQGKKEKKSVSDILDIVSLVTDLVGAVAKTFFGHLRIKLTRIKLVIGTGDAATTAIAYGAVTQAVNILFPILEGVKNFTLPKTQELDVRADFAAEESEIDICISFSLRVWHLFHVIFAALGKAIKYFFKSMAKKSQG